MKRNIIKITWLAFTLLSILVLPSCLKDDYTKKLNQEKEDIKVYMTSHGLTPDTVYNEALYVFKNRKGTGDSLKTYTDYALIKFKASMLSGILYDSTDTIDFTTINGNGYYPSFAPGGPFLLSAGSGFAGLIQALYTMREGGKSTFIMSSTITGTGDFMPRIYEIELLKVYHDIAATRAAEFKKEMTTVGFTFSAKDSTASGVFFKIDSTAVNPTAVSYPRIGDTVMVKYTGRLIDTVGVNSLVTRKFYTESSAYFVVGYSNVYAFQQIMTKMKIGMKANVYVPSNRGFGALGLRDYSQYDNGQIVVPAYANLMYENVEFLGYAKKIVNISDNTVQWIVNTARK